MKHARFLIACLIILSGARVWAISIRLPDTSLACGVKGKTLVLPLLVDSITAADSIGGFDIRITCDTLRLRPIQVTTEGTIVGLQSQFSVDWEHGSLARGGFRFWAVGDGVATLVGKGVLLLIWFQVLDDTAGSVPIGFVPDQVQFNKFEGPNSVAISVGTTGSVVSFYPTAALNWDSVQAATTKDTVVTVSARFAEIRGDAISGVHAKLVSSDTAVKIVDVDTIGTLAGTATSFSATQVNGGAAMVIDAQGVGTAAQETTFVRVKLLTRCHPAYAATVRAESLTVAGAAAAFHVQADTSRIDIACTEVGVSEPVLAVSNDFRIYPNPAATEIRVARTMGVSGSMELIDLAGRVVRRAGPAGGSEVRFVLAGLTDGVYGVRDVGSARLIGTIVVAR